TIRHYLPEVREVRIMARETVADPQALFDQVINPTIATHGGKIVLNRVEGDSLFLSFEGGCQGCAMAELTLRQGIEPILAQQIPAIKTVIDETEHALGTAPFFKTKKS
ncbi:MAG: hypothetical protein HOB72_23740, partial [Rhodospirillaceae bacterium]|nr:hypothetical protein [Rhodospirillaceae bacterium]